MADIETIFINTATDIDFALDNLVLKEDDGLTTAIILSLFTDRRAEDADVAPGENKRGAWIDTYAETQGDKFGSRLWLLEREKLLPETVNRVKTYCEEALQWLVEDGIAKVIEVTATIIRHTPLGIIAADISIHKPDGNITQYKFDQLWSQA